MNATASGGQTQQWNHRRPDDFLLVAVTYALIGVVIGPLLGKVAGVFVAFLIPFLDLGIIQSPMLRPEPQEWARFLPAYGVTKVLFDTGAHGAFRRNCAITNGIRVASRAIHPCRTGSQRWPFGAYQKRGRLAAEPENKFSRLTQQRTDQGSL